MDLGKNLERRCKILKRALLVFIGLTLLVSLVSAQTKERQYKYFGREYPGPAFDDFKQYNYQRIKDDSGVRDLLSRYGYYTYWRDRKARVLYSYYPDWRPYFYGHWQYYPYFGWVWIPDEPWSWITTHFGYWLFTDIGWVWIVDEWQWKPAQVWWAWGNDWIAWRPWYPEWYAQWYQDHYHYFSDDIFRYDWVVVKKLNLIQPSQQRNVLSQEELNRINRNLIKISQNFPSR